MMEFDPEDERFVAAAGVAATVASAMARIEEGESLPMPPNNLPCLRSIAGSNSFEKAMVLGYKVERQEVQDSIGPDGKKKVPGDPGFLEAHIGRLTQCPEKMKGWTFKVRVAQKLFAIVDGNPVLLEQQAKMLGYARALATGPNVLDLGEIEYEPVRNQG